MGSETHPTEKDLSPARRRAVNRLLAAFIERQPSDQPRFLEDCRKRWPRLTGWVDRLLDHDRGELTISFLNEPLGRMAEHVSALSSDQSAVDLEPGYRLGPWRLEKLIGEGGMGVVFHGERADGAFEKSVAIKLLRMGGNGPSELMQQECRLLARIEHPVVTRLLDAGVDQRAGPFLVMEWVAGQDLPDWLATKPSTMACLDVFEALCEGLEHAHRNRVIHGDIKPSNVRIDPHGRPRLMDFGIAQLIETGASGDRAIGQTPGFSAPEQVEGSPLTPACDVWSLGSLLRWLMNGCGALPDRELEAIADRACSASPDQRYGSAGELAADVRNYRERRPVRALQATTGYRARRFVSRNPVLMGGMTATVLALGIGLGLTWVWYQQADRQARELEQVVAFQEDQLASIEPHVMGLALREAMQDELARIGHGPLGDVADPLEGVNFTNIALAAVEGALFDQSLTAIDERFSDQPVVQARLLQTLATAMRAVGLLQQALPVQERALQTFREHRGDTSPETLDSQRQQGQLLVAMGELERGQEVLRSAYRVSTEVYGPDASDTVRARFHLAGVLRTLGQHELAMEKYRSVLDQRQKSLGGDHPATLEAKARLGAMLRDQGRLDEARPYYARVLEAYLEQYGELHPDTLQSMNNKGLLLARMGHYEESESLYRRAWEGQRERHGDQHFQTLQTAGNLGVALRKLGRTDEALDFYFMSAEGLEAQLGKHHPRTMGARHNLGVVLRETDRMNEAEEVLTSVVDHRAEALGKDARPTAISRHELAWTLRERGRYREALQIQRRAMTSLAEQYGDESWLFGAFLSGKALILVKQQRFLEAESAWLDTLAIFRRSLGEDHPRYQETLEHLETLYPLWQEHHPVAGTVAQVSASLAVSGIGEPEQP